MKKILLTGLFTGSLILGDIAGLARASTIYDALAQFDLNSNPSSVGYWNYGYTQTLGDTFILLTTKQTGDYGGSWGGWGLAPTRYPNILKNFTMGVLTFVPGINGEYAVIRWVAPKAGKYNINTTFSGYYDEPQGTNADVHVLHNNISLFDSIITNKSSESFGALLTLSTGDAIDFSVGDGPDDYAWDRVVLNATVTSVPEPSTMLLVGISMVTMAGFGIRRRK